MPTTTVRLTRPQRSSDLDAVLAEVDRHLGPGVATTLHDGPAPVEAIPTGSLALDLALGVGGLPRGRITEVYGPEGPARPPSP
jgi:recombination protein RecA